ncbi:Na(+)/H(+) exchange regulatory cofactor NHE-RF1a [Electrophorus electricus]|uniref:Na(+)/H(+) exchange regulatory cofactor NHE-RF n=1 Tax=Electrophorus electricus TaxID=8005 RepID=A0A4W4GBP2_ELEEL|nr:Na(+)/H(+) exchange regulatory cofactor NHE-RF1a [Electrophorus electricus]
MSSNLRPRLCVVEKGADGYGFHLHGEKGKPGQFIRLVEPNSPAEISGLLAGDRVAFVNGERVEGESHQQVVSRIRAVTGKLDLIVIDAETEQLLKEHNLKCQIEFVTGGIPLPRSESDSKDEDKNDTPMEPTPVSNTNGDIAIDRLSVSSKESKNELRPRLCHMKKGAMGYGFNLHSEKSKPGQCIRAVDEGSPAEQSGLRPQDKVVEVNGVSVLGMQHSDVVAAIKAGGDELRMLVVDPDTEAFFSQCQVQPTEQHLTGPLPEPAPSGGADEELKEEGPEETQPSALASPATPMASSTSSTPTAAVACSPPPEEKPEEKGLCVDEGSDLDLNMSLQQAKERAHQKRSNKRAPPMDWSKRSELFSNL